MPTANIVGNQVLLNVNGTHGDLDLDLSLQRHHYNFCAQGGAIEKNSLLYFSVANADVTTDCTEVGKQMERLLNANHRPQVLFGVQFTCPSGRVYLVDNTALDPNGFPNHFFPTSGPKLWGQMTQAEYIAASAIRRVEEAINAKPAASRSDLLNGQKLHALQRSPGGNQNPVVAAYIAARTALQPVAPQVDAKLEAVSGRKDIIALARTF